MVFDPPPLTDRLFAAGERLQLLGGRRRDSGRIVFPCPASDLFEPIELSAEGRLWSFTIQRFRPKSPPYSGPQTFEPFALGYVELPGEVIVETRIVAVAFDALRIGMPMMLTTEIVTDAAGEARTSYAFTTSEEMPA